MNKWKKAISVGMSAALLASLFTMTASSVFAAAGSGTVTGPVTVLPGATSTDAITLNFTEGTGTGVAATDYAYPGVGGPVLCPGSPAACFGFTLRLFDKNGGDTISFSGTPAISGQPGSLTGFVGTLTSLGAGTNNGLVVTFTNSNTAQSEPFSITGLKIKATALAPAGQMRLQVVATTGPGAGQNWGQGAAGINAFSAFGNGTTTVSATTSAAVIAGATTVPLTGADGGAAFGVSGAVTIGGIAGSNGLLVITDGASSENVGITAGTFGPPSTSLTTNALGFGHVSGTSVSQTVVVQGLLASPGSVANGLVEDTCIYTEPCVTTIQPGETNQRAGGVDVTETAAGTLAAATVVTFTLDTAGVQFSTSPWVVPTGASLNLGGGVGTGVLCPLSFDRMSCSVTVSAKSTAVGHLVLAGDAAGTLGVLVDVATTVSAGTAVGVNVTTAPALAVKVTDNVIANVGRVVVSTGAQPTIYINENDQPSGMITLAEQAAGTFTAGPSSNYFGLCIKTGETFTRAPWAVVTAGDLKLRDGAAAATSVKGTLFAGPGGISCVEWVVWSASTTASTIEIRGSDASGVVLPSGASNGPRLSVGPTLAPGTTRTDVLAGSKANVEGDAAAALLTISSNALRAFRNQPAVAAVSQPAIPVGTSDSLLGNLTITETQAGQFKPNERIFVSLQPVVAPGIQSVVLFNTGTTSKTPVVATNSASGLLTSAITFTSSTTFFFTVAQQATGTLGVITISNMHVFTVTGATPGPILVRVSSDTAGVTIDQTVSNGRVVAALAADAWIGKGLNARASSAFTLATVVTKRGSYVTIRGRIAGAGPGTLVGIWVKTKTTAWHLETSRRVSTNGYMYYSGHVNNLGYRYYRVNAAGATSNTVRAYGK